MTETVHVGIVPSIGIENQIIDKKANKWESVLLHLSVFAILLPSAAESISAFFVVLSFLIPRGWRLVPKAHPIPILAQKLWKSLFFLWLLLLIMAVLQCFAHGDGKDFQPYLRLIGKQGVWGSCLIAAFIYLQMKRTRTFLNPKALILYTLALVLYAVLQRTYGFDWVHGLQARLGANREAYGIFRVSGFMDHPLTLAFNLMLFSLLSFAQGLWLWKKTRTGAARLWLVQSLILLVLLFLTDSRYPTLLTLLLMGAALIWEFPKLRKYVAGAVAVGALVTIALATFLPLASFGRWGELFDSKVALEQRFDRLIFWKINWQIFWERPWIGTGLARYDATLLDTYLHAGYTGLERKYNAHNIYLQTLADGGILGAIGLLVLLTALGRLAKHVSKRYHHRGLVLIFLATLGGGIAQNHLRDTEYLFALWTCIGLCLSVLIVEPGNRAEGAQGSDDSQ